jgi:predicted phosphodiesterase
MRLGFIADIHEDVQNLKRALSILAKEKCDTLICLGDITGFTIPFYRYIETRNAEECIRLVKENCSVVVAGNHDLYAVKKVPLHKAGFNYSDDWYNLDYEVRAKKSKNRIWLYEDNEIRCRLSDCAREYLLTLNETEFREFDNLKFLFSHFCYPDFSGSAIFFPREAFHLKKHFDFMKENNCTISISGHGHPEGAIVVSEDKFRFSGFGSQKFTGDLHWIVMPCVARTSRLNGVMVLDTSAGEFSTISFNSYENNK